ncbi:MAG: aspartate aminotransferase family protein [Candidatus Bathyarchaeia archaeon]
MKTEELYLSRTRNSSILHERAVRVLPGGVTSSLRMRHPYPFYIRKAEGSKVVDVDGNEYLDFVMGAGPLILGHRPPAVIQAVREQLEKEFQGFFPTELEVELAEKVREYVPCAEMVRFVPSGTEACTTLCRIARAYCNKDKIAKVEGGYHGQYDATLVSQYPLPGISGPANHPRPVFDSIGMPRRVLDEVVVLPFNNIEASVRLLRENARELAAVLVEPILGPAGMIVAKKEYLKALREVTEENDVLLIFDEVQTGFRLGLGGAQQFFGLKPDLAMLGKILGGGFPIGACVGRKDIFDRVVTPTSNLYVNMSSKIFQSGTFSGHSVSLAAGLATIKELEKGHIYPYLNKISSKLREGLAAISNDTGAKIQVTGLESMFGIHFTKHSIESLRDVYRFSDASMREQFARWLLVKHNIINGPRVSYAHSEGDIEKFLKSSEDAIRNIMTGRTPTTTIQENR